MTCCLCFGWRSARSRQPDRLPHRGTAGPSATSRGRRITVVGDGSLDDALRACLTATRLGVLIGLPPDVLKDVYYMPLMALVGCTSSAHMASSVFGPEIETFSHAYEVDPTDGLAMLRAMLPAIGNGRPPFERLAIFGKMLANMAMFGEGSRGHCEVAQMLGARLGFAPYFQSCLLQVFERWDGKGKPNGVKAEMIELPARLGLLANLACAWTRVHGSNTALRMIADRHVHGHVREIEPSAAAHVDG